MQSLNAKAPLLQTLAWAGGVAVLLVMLTERPNAGWFGLMFGYLLAQVLHQRRLLQQLLDRDAAAAVASPVVAASRPAAAAERSEPDPVRTSPVVERPAEAARATVQDTTAAAAAPRRAAPQEPGPINVWLESAMRWLRRGNPLARVGIVVLFFGATFLVRYSAEQGLLPLEFRLAGLAAGAIALLLVGWRLRGRRRALSRTLQGGGIAGFYLTVFAAMRLYALLPQQLALALLVVVAVCSAVLAVAQNALSLAVIATAGGFLAPILVSTGGGSHVALFTYYAVLNLGVMAVAWFRAWRLLNLLGFLFTFGVTGAFRGLSYSSADRWSTDFFLLLFFLMYVLLSVLFAWRQKPDLRGYVSGSLVFGLPVVVFSLHSSLIADIPFALAWSALGFAAFYLALAGGLFRHGRDSFRLLAEAFTALGIIFASLAIPLAFDQQTTAAMWAIEGAGLLWLGIRQSRLLARAFGGLLQFAGGLGFLIGLDGLPGTVPLLNSAWLGSLMLAAGGLCSGFWLLRAAGNLHAREALASPLALIWGSLWWLGGGLAEINRWAPPEIDFGLCLLFLAGSTAILFELGRRLRWSACRQLAALLWPMSAMAGLLWSAELQHPGAHWGYFGWPPLLLSLGWLLWQQDCDGDEILASGQGWLHALGCWTLAIIVAWELDWLLAHSIAGVWQVLPWGAMAVLLLWAFAAQWPAWPVARHAAVYGKLVAVPVAVFAVLWLVAVSLAQSGYSGLPYLPLLNPLDLLLAAVLLSVLRWWLSLTRAVRGSLWSGQPLVPVAVFASLVFLVLNSALVRALHHLAGTPLGFSGVLHSFTVQASLSVFWGLLGLAGMFIANRRAWRVVWLAGAGLMGVVVVKLFLIDLSGSGGLARIVSFMSVGGLLLLAGYVAPLPPVDVELAENP